MAVRMLEDNADIAANLQQKSLPTEQFMQIDIGGGYSKHNFLAVH